MSSLCISLDHPVDSLPEADHAQRPTHLTFCALQGEDLCLLDYQQMCLLFPSLLMPQESKEVMLSQVFPALGGTAVHSLPPQHCPSIDLLRRPQLLPPLLFPIWQDRRDEARLRFELRPRCLEYCLPCGAQLLEHHPPPFLRLPPLLLGSTCFPPTPHPSLFLCILQHPLPYPCAGSSSSPGLGHSTCRPQASLGQQWSFSQRPRAPVLASGCSLNP